MKRKPGHESFLQTVHFLIYGHSKTFYIKEGMSHAGCVRIVDFMQVSEQVR